MSVSFDRYPRFAELSEWLQGFATDYPELVDLSVLGSSHEGRELWLLTVTNRSTGDHLRKPAVWLDWNIHASEVTASVALVHLVHHLVTGYGTDERITRALDTRTFYIVPRVNPDGAELALAEVPFVVRSTTRSWPRTDQRDGLIPGDIDHDGRSLQMRIEDPNGTWKPYANDPRLLIARDPDEDGDGPYYRLLREGQIQNYDGVTIAPAPALAGIDSNRNFPYEWRRYPKGEFSPSGAGDYPGSEPEVRAVVQGLVDRPNVCAYFAYHTWSGVHLRPYSNLSDEALPSADLWTFEEYGRRYTEITGYPSVSVYHGFRYDPKDVITGVADDWAYDHLGVYAWTTEFWNPLVAAGIADPHPIDWYRHHSLDDELALLAWIDENVPEGYVDWYPFDHPDLGRVELGGWHNALVFRNPPPHLLEREVAPHSELAVFTALTTPQLRLRSAEVESLGASTWRVRVVVENTGWLPTNVTKKAIEKRVVDGVSAVLTVPDAVRVVGQDARLDLGQLGGRALRESSIGMFGSAMDGTSDRAKADWIIEGPAGTEVTATISHARAGSVSVTLELR